MACVVFHVGEKIAHEVSHGLDEPRVRDFAAFIAQQKGYRLDVSARPWSEPTQDGSPGARLCYPVVRSAVPSRG